MFAVQYIPVITYDAHSQVTRAQLIPFALAPPLTCSLSNSLRVIIAPTVSASQVQLEQISFVRVPIVTCSCVGACRERDGARRPVRAAAGDRVDEPQEHGRAPLPASHSTRVPRIQPTPSYPLTTILDLAFE